MTKPEFLEELKAKLSFLPEEDLKERLAFYEEGIEDRIDEGISEADAVSQLGEIDYIVKQILQETPLTKLVKEKAKPKRTLKVLEIILLILGSPIWLSLLICIIAVILSLYVVLWSVVISLWAVFVSFIACALGGIASGIYFIVSGNTLSGAAMLSAGMVCAGLGIFTFYGCKAATKGNFMLAKKIILGVKKCFIGKGEA